MGFSIKKALSGSLGTIIDPLDLTGVRGAETAYQYWKKEQKQTYEMQKALAALEYDYTLKSAKEGPSAWVQGLRDANLNPILAATEGQYSSLPSYNMPSVNTVSGTGGVNTKASAALSMIPFVGGLMSNLASARQANAQAANLKTITANTDRSMKADIALKTAQAAKINAGLATEGYGKGLIGDSIKATQDAIKSATSSSPNSANSAMQGIGHQLMSVFGRKSAKDVHDEAVRPKPSTRERSRQKWQEYHSWPLWKQLLLGSPASL